MIYFAADVHLGLRAGDPAEREIRFAQWLRSLRKPDTEALYLLGDIWDFWYEYRYVIPAEGARVAGAIIELVDYGVKVYYVPGNHDIWLYSFWQKSGVQILQQPQVLELQGKRLLVGHGDALGGAARSYRFMLKIFHSRVCQVLFSGLHPWLAFRFANSWSNSSRRKHGGYKFKGEAEPLYQFCKSECEKAAAAGKPFDYCVFGHFHDAVDMPVGSSRLVVLKDWIDGGVHYAALDRGQLEVF